MEMRCRTIIRVLHVVDYAVAICVCLVSAAALSGVFSAADVVGMLKILTTTGLLITSAMSPWQLSARAAAAIICASFAAHNLGSVIVGRGDCGCFPVSIPPAVTGSVDAIFAGWFAWRSRGIAGCYWWCMFALLGISAGVVVGVLAPKSKEAVAPNVAQQVVATFAAAPLPTIGERLLPSDHYGMHDVRTIIIHRSSCPHCQEQLAILRMTLPPTANWLHSHLQVELDEGQITTLDGNPTPDAESLRPLLSRARFWPVPILITVVDGTVVSVEGRSQQQ